MIKKNVINIFCEVHKLNLIKYLLIKKGKHKFVLGMSEITYGSESESGPVETVDVLAGQRAVLRAVHIVHPVVGAESDRVTDTEIKTCVPVYQHDDGEHYFTYAERVRVACSSFSSVEEF